MLHGNKRGDLEVFTYSPSLCPLVFHCFPQVLSRASVNGLGDCYRIEGWRLLLAAEEDGGESDHY